MLKLAEKKALFPVIVFSFVRLECESFAMHAWNESMKSGSLDFTTEEEKEAIEQVTLSIHAHACACCTRSWLQCPWMGNRAELLGQTP